MAFLLQMPDTLDSKTDGGSRRTKREINFVFCSIFKQLCDSESFNLHVHLYPARNWVLSLQFSQTVHSSMESIKVISNIFSYPHKWKLPQPWRLANLYKLRIWPSRTQCSLICRQSVFSSYFHLTRVSLEISTFACHSSKISTVLFFFLPCLLNKDKKVSNRLKWSLVTWFSELIL